MIERRIEYISREKHAPMDGNVRVELMISREKRRGGRRSQLHLVEIPGYVIRVLAERYAEHLKQQRQGIEHEHAVLRSVVA